jgi:hypothetical protein
MPTPSFRLLLLMLCFVGQPTRAQKPQTVPSKIEAVTVFTKGAQITRKAKTTLAAGKTELVFAALSPQLDPQSIQVKGDGNFTILSVVHQLNSISENKRGEDVEGLENQKRALRRKAAVDRKMLDVFKNEEKILRDNQSVSTISVSVKTTELKELADFQRSRLTEVLLKQLEIEYRIQQSDSTIARIDQRLQNFTAPREIPSGEVVVTVLAKEPGSATFDISYLVNTASWYPNYDIRVKDINSPIELGFKANVSQQSGEDWRDVKLTISTGNPKESSVAPSLQTWNLGFGYPALPGFNAAVNGAVSGRVTDRQGHALPGVNVQVKGTSLGTTTGANGMFSLLVPKGGRTLVFSQIGYARQEVEIKSNQINVSLAEDTNTLSEVVVTGYGTDAASGGRAASIPKAKLAPTTIPLETTETYQPTTLSYDIEEPYTILTDGKVYTADIKTYSLPATYDYLAIPKLDKDAFLTAHIPDWKDQNLLEGEARLFFEGAYLGKTLLDVRDAGDTLNLSLGRDRSIVIERKRLPNFTSKAFLSDKRTLSRGFDITVRNNKQQPITITVQDQLPVSTEKDIVLDNVEVDGGEIAKDTKLVTWKYDLPAKQSRKHGLKYSVRYPKDQIVVLE